VPALLSVNILHPPQLPGAIISACGATGKTGQPSERRVRLVGASALLPRPANGANGCGAALVLPRAPEAGAQVRPRAGGAAMPVGSYRTMIPGLGVGVGVGTGVWDGVGEGEGWSGSPEVPGRGMRLKS
jgi:hypothetical protein